MLELSDSLPNRVFHAAMARTTPATTSPVDGFFHRLDTDDDGFT
ncbi:hypothetical protein AB0F36_31470 [Streptomyces sp. NPDC029080]